VLTVRRALGVLGVLAVLAVIAHSAGCSRSAKPV
jgi:hypothetical protein